ncbi:MAG TPA: amidohydrolase family protein [Candidatus Dormibacteraeota bacterium]|nr:amidohydrolase family protein [Candidatus Dormibacteraeota bacterium]
MKLPDGVRAIDVHVHPNHDEAIASGGEYLEWAKRHFRDAAPDAISIDATAEMYRGHRMMAVLLGKDARTNTRLPAIPNDSIARAVRDHPDVFLGFGSVDPHQDIAWCVEEVQRCHELGLAGLKFQQAVQGFSPNEERYYPIYEKASSLRMVCLFHMGTTGIGAGAPGGMGLRLEYCRPILVDRVAADFPDLTIIGAHPGWPWTEELLAMAVHKGNLFIDLSGWAPKYFPPMLVQYARTLLKDKVLFGTDWPLLTVERWEAEFAALDFPPDVVERIMLTNAMRVLGLEPAG